MKAEEGGKMLCMCAKESRLEGKKKMCVSVGVGGGGGSEETCLVQGLTHCTHTCTFSHISDLLK